MDVVTLDGEPFRLVGRDRWHHPNEVSRARGVRAAPYAMLGDPVMMDSR